MKVLVVGTGGSLAGSGITTAADQMVRTLERMGHEPMRLVAGARLRKRPNRLNLENVVAVLTEAVAVARAARATRAEIVWLHTFGVPTLPALRVLAQVMAVRAVGCRIVVRLHAFGLEEHLARAGPLQRLVVRLTGRFSSQLVAEHERAAEALERIVGGGVVSVLHNWVDVPRQVTSPPAGPPFRALFVGGLVARKGVPQLLAAMRLLEDVPLHLRLVGGAGDDGAAAADSLRHSAVDLVERGCVEFVGPLDPAGVRAELAGAHVFVLPSRAEGMPFAMLEAMAEGRPVLVSAAGNMRQIVAETGCGVVLESTELVSIAEALRRGCDHPDRWAAQGVKAHRAALERYSTEAAVQQLAVVLRRALEIQV